VITDITNPWFAIQSPQTFAVADGPAVKPSLPIKNVEFLSADTDLTMGEWAIIKPLFSLYVERECATRLEASRGLGVDVFGRSVSEISQDITVMETETIPAKTMVHAVIEVD
jgi:hypothetical protein